MQQGDEARVRLQLRPRAGHMEQRLRGGRKQQPVDQPPVHQEQGTKPQAEQPSPRKDEP